MVVVIVWQAYLSHFQEKEKPDRVCLDAERGQKKRDHLFTQISEVCITFNVELGAGAYFIDFLDQSELGAACAGLLLLE